MNISCTINPGPYKIEIRKIIHERTESKTKLQGISSNNRQWFYEKIFQGKFFVKIKIQEPDKRKAHKYREHNFFKI